MCERIIDTLHALGISPRLVGYHQLYFVLCLIVEDPTRLASLSKSVYTPTAEHFGCNPQCIERNIRFVIGKAWAANPDYLKKLAGFPMKKKPAVSIFLEVLSAHVLG